MAVIIGTSGNDTLTGTSANDTIQGLAGDDTLHGGAGSDVLIGGTGNDTFFVENSFDQAIENAGEGFDVVNAFVTFTLPANVEGLALQGSGAINGTGNSLDNFILGNAAANSLNGGAGDDVLDGFLGNDSLNGGTGNDTLLGGDGIDILNGGLGIDTMQGGTGNDTYLVNDAGDIAIELENGGLDKVLATVSFTLGANIEDLELTGSTASIDGTGNALDNIIIGNNGDNILSGGKGDDRLLGKGGADTLIGGPGTDTMHGQLGDDTFVVDNAADLVFEDIGEGVDVVEASVTYTLAAGQEIEELRLTTGANTSATGNEFGNTIVGNAGSNILDGLQGNDVLIGLEGNDAFRFGPGFGVDQILDFQGAGVAGGDTVLLQNSGLTSFNEVLPFIADIQGGCQIALNASDVLTIANVSKAQFNADDFLFA